MTGHIRSYELKNHDRRWAVVVYQGKRSGTDGKLCDSYRWIRGFPTKKEAQTELNRLLKSVDDGTYVEPTKETVGAYLERWLNTYAKGNVGAKTLERYRQIVTAVNGGLGSIPLSKLQPVQIAHFYATALEAGNTRNGGGLSAQTVLHYHRLLRHALSQAVRWQLRATNPADAVDAPRPRAKEMTALTGDTAVWLIHAAESTEMHLPILMALCTGMRRGEILGLRWRDLDLDSCRLTVHQALEQTRASGVHFKTPKTARSRRTITIPKILVDVLAQHRKQTDERRRLFGADYLDADLVIPLPDGSPWPPDRFTDAYVAFTRKIGARGIRFHDLRHTHASQLLREGIPVKTVAQRLGHANPSVTLNVYAHVMTGDDQRAADLVENVLTKRVGSAYARSPN